MDTTALVSAFLQTAGGILAELRSNPLAQADADLLKLKRTVLSEKLRDFKSDLADHVKREKARAEQDLISRGLGNSTIRLTMLRGIDQQAVADTERVVREYNRAFEEVAIIERRVAEQGAGQSEPSCRSPSGSFGTPPEGARMFNVLISADETAWESEQRMGMQTGRFLEHSGDESEAISLDQPETLKTLERVQSLLLYENGVNGPGAGFVRVGQLRDIRVKGGQVTFRFAESGRIPRDQFDGVRERLQISDWEMGRTHWAVKDGDIPQDVLAMMKPTPKRYDVVLSFAGEDRDYVERVAEFLEVHGVVAFYDKYEEATLWGKDLAEHFDGVYRKQGRFCVMFISRAYANKMWTRHERRSALARALEEHTEYVLPARFDDTEIPGLRPTIMYQDLRKLTPERLGELILQKLGRR